MSVHLDCGGAAENKVVGGDARRDPAAGNAAKEWIFHDDSKNPISNFEPVAISPVNVIKNGVIESKIRIGIRFANGESDKKPVISQVELEDGKVRWSDHDRRVLFHPDYAKSKVGRYIASKVLSELDYSSIETIYHIDVLGKGEIDRTVFYCAGSEFILAPGAENTLNLELGALSQRLDIDIGRYTEAAAMIGIVKLIDLSPSARQVIFAHTLSAIMRSAYSAIGITPRTVLQVVAKTNSLKTTFVTLVSQLYNRKDGIKPHARFNSTLSFIGDILHSNRDCVVVIDDLHPAKSTPALKRENEAKLEEITRRIGDDMGKGVKKGNSNIMLDPQSNIIVPAEYGYGEGSTATRTLIVELSEKIDNMQLQRCQDEPLLASTFYYYFITWYVANYNEIIKALKKLLLEFRANDFHDVERRLNETFFCLYSAFVLFLQYCHDKGFITQEEAKDTTGSFYELLKGLIYAQQERYEQSVSDDGDGGSAANEVKISYLERICAMYSINQFNLSSCAKSFDKDVHDGFTHKEHLCLFPEKLVSKIKEVYPAADKKEIVKELFSKRALKKDTDGNNAKQVNAAGNKRFYWIPLGKLARL